MHEFSIYFKNLNDIVFGFKLGDYIVIRDFELKKRLIKVLHLKQGDEFLLFDGAQSVKFILADYQSSKKLCVKIIAIDKNRAFKPEIILCPAILKKKSFEDVLYSASAMPVRRICPLITSKIHKNWICQNNVDRLHRIIISACEQSKNFVVPRLEQAVELDVFLNDKDFKKAKSICFHITGDFLFDLFLDLKQKKYQQIYLFFGPEGDFSDSELSLFKKNDIEFYRLTDTTLRSMDAITVGLGSVASLL